MSSVKCRADGRLTSSLMLLEASTGLVLKIWYVLCMYHIHYISIVNVSLLVSFIIILNKLHLHLAKVRYHHTYTDSMLSLSPAVRNFKMLCTTVDVLCNNTGMKIVRIIHGIRWRPKT